MGSKSMFCWLFFSDLQVTEWRFAKGTSTGFHRHSMDYVVIPLTSGTLTLVTKDDESGKWTKSTFNLSPGVAYTRKAGVEHDVQRPADDTSVEGDIAFSEVEMKAYRG